MKLLRSKSRETKTAPKTEGFRAVSIVVRGRACKKARELTGTRLLLSEAPPLPLEGCTVIGCGCKYRQHADRRVEPRRSIDLGITSNLWVGPDRRKQPDRRRAAEDQDDGSSYFDYFRR